jgi:hypothetical protein
VAERSRQIAEGAAQAAPTAPHATPRAGKGCVNGPERFWSHWRVRVVLGVTLVLSGVAHCYAVPIQLPSADLQVNDDKEPASIPIDLFDDPGQDTETVESPAPAPTGAQPGAQDTPKTNDPLAMLPKADAGAPRDGGPRDAAGDAPTEAGRDGAPTDAASFEGGAQPLAGDAGDGGGAVAADPQALLQASRAVQAKDPYVTLVLNGEEIRNHPLGSKVAPLLHSINDWQSFMGGTEQFFDPVRDTDWLSISGPSLRDSRLDAITLHYSTTDANMDKAVAAMAHNYDKGGPFDAGVAALPAWLAKADGNERVILRPQSHLVVIVPPADAPGVAQSLAGQAPLPKSISKLAGIAVMLKLREPHHAMPGILPAELNLVQAWIKPHHDDGGLDVEIEGTCKDAASAESAAQQVKDTITRNAPMVNLVTDDLLDGAEVRTEGSHVRVHLTASRRQAESTLKALQVIVPSLQPQPAPAASH